MGEDKRKMLTIKEAANYIGVSASTIKNWIVNGSLPAERKQTKPDSFSTGKGVQWLISFDDLLETWAEKSKLPRYQKRLEKMIE